MVRGENNTISQKKNLLATITRATTTTTTGTSFYLFIFSSFSCEKKNSLDGTMPEIIIIISQL
jgi:hypothetical protein